MDLGNIVYIVAVLAYFIYQATRKKKGQEMTESDGSAPDAPQKGLTFEDLMREIRQAQNPSSEKSEPLPQKTEVQQPPKPQPYRNQPVPSHIPQPQVSYRKPIPVEDDDEIKYYEGTFGATKKSPYEDYKKAQSIPMVSSIKMDYDSLQEKKYNRYAELLKNPKTLREAIIVSEILRPKHF